MKMMNILKNKVTSLRLAMCLSGVDAQAECSLSL